MGSEKIREPAFDVDLYDLRHVFDLGIIARNDTRDHRKPTGFRASSLGYCLRRQILERLDVPPIVEEEPSRTLFIGDRIHYAYQRMFTDAGLMLVEEQELVDPEWELTGHVDMIWGGHVQVLDPEELDSYSDSWARFLIDYRSSLEKMYGPEPFPVTMTELKSAAQYSAERMYKEGPSAHHSVQIGSYAAMALRRPEQLPEGVGPIERYEIAVVAKSDGAMVRFDVLPSHIERAVERITRLKAYWDARTFPPCSCGEELGWEPNYCRYKTHVRGACCPDTLLDESLWAELEDADGEDAGEQMPTWDETPGADKPQLEAVPDVVEKTPSEKMGALRFRYPEGCPVCKEAAESLDAYYTSPVPNGEMAELALEEEAARLEGVLDEHPNHTEGGE